jgi:hypothetical protein
MDRDAGAFGAEEVATEEVATEEVGADEAVDGLTEDGVVGPSISEAGCSTAAVSSNGFAINTGSAADSASTGMLIGASCPVFWTG